MRQRFFATFTIAAVVPFSGQDAATLVQAVSISNQNQDPMVTSMIDKSLQSLANGKNSEGIKESEHLLAQTNDMDSALTMFGQIASNHTKYENDEEYQEAKKRKHILHEQVVES